MVICFGVLFIFAVRLRMNRTFWPQIINVLGKKFREIKFSKPDFDLIIFVF